MLKVRNGKELTFKKKQIFWRSFNKESRRWDRHCNAKVKEV